VTQTEVFDVLADSEDTARTLACDRASDHLWSSGTSADYSPYTQDILDAPGEPFESVDDAGFSSKRCWLLPNGKHVYRNTWNNNVSIPDPRYLDVYTRDFDTLEEGLLWWAVTNRQCEEEAKTRKARRKK